MEDRMRVAIIIILSCIFVNANAQPSNQLVEKGNADYKKKAFQQAETQYKKALEKDPKNTVAQFNSGNAKQQLKKYAEATSAYEAVAASATDPYVKAKAFYNQGLAYVHQKKLKEAIDAFKKSLRLNANDKEARENLQKALEEKKQQDQPKSGDQQKDKNKKNQPPNQKPEQRKPKMTEEEAEKMLNDLRKEEKDIQKQLQQKNSSSRQLKDW